MTVDVFLYQALKKRLDKYGIVYGLTHPKTLALSRRLDKIVVRLQKQINGIR